MYYRITKISHKEGDKDKMVAHLESMNHLIDTIEGLNKVQLISVSPTEVIGISEYDNADQVEKAQEKFNQIMGGMKSYFTGPPEVYHGDVFWGFETK